MAAQQALNPLSESIFYHCVSTHTHVIMYNHAFDNNNDAGVEGEGSVRCGRGVFVRAGT